MERWIVYSYGVGESWGIFNSRSQAEEWAVSYIRSQNEVEEEEESYYDLSKNRYLLGDWELQVVPVFDPVTYQEEKKNKEIAELERRIEELRSGGQSSPATPMLF